MNVSLWERQREPPEEITWLVRREALAMIIGPVRECSIDC